MYTSYTEAKKSLNDVIHGMEPYEGGGREAYLEWIKRWRHAYKGLSRVIRELKRCRKEFKYEYREKGNDTAQRRIATGPNPFYDSHAPLYLDELFRPAARNMMEMRVEAKERAREDAQAERQAA